MGPILASFAYFTFNKQKKVANELFMDALGIFVPFDGILPLQKWPNFGKIISPTGHTLDS